ncbi:MAG: riboflavin biosynthesis protein RibF [Lentisphaerae bacterium]|nr:riboflavin biosynthesis protein RibF [Lentisphaerota bacterium]
MKCSDFFLCGADMGLERHDVCADKPMVLAIGVFDGVHLGHRKLLDEAVRLAQELNAVPAALTFDPHPRSVLFPETPTQLLMELQDRLRLLVESGMAMTAVAEFTREFAATEPEVFLDGLFRQIPQLAGIVVGSCWRFGARGTGNVELLGRYAAGHGLQLRAVPELQIGTEVVSASTIRRLIAEGKLDEAAELLGRSYTLAGQVSSGYGIAGSKLDCPTANIVCQAGVLPPNGVYAGWIECNKGSFAAAVNIGVAPTYDRSADKVRRIEAHLLDFNGNLYDQRVKLTLGRYLRAEQRFDCEENLKKQIACDVENIRRWAAENMR